MRADLKLRFEAAGIMECELQREGCWRDNALVLAHSKRRRFIETDEDMREVDLACDICHGDIEILPRAEMENIVRNIIASREIKM